jgi:hypothetical protein
VEKRENGVPAFFLRDPDKIAVVVNPNLVDGLTPTFLLTPTSKINVS